MLESNEELNRKFIDVIRKLSTHDKYFRVVFDDLEVANCNLKIATRVLRFLVGFEVANSQPQNKSR